MTLSYNWLKDYINSELSAVEMAEIFTAIGLEIEGVQKVESVPGGLEGLIVAEVLTCTKHPDADKLSITTLLTGGESTLQVVCGAPNVAAGQKVILATVGTTLYPVGDGESFKIKKSKIRGVESLGMICAMDEIGIGTSHDGIIVLPAETLVGTPAAAVFNLEGDYLLEVGLTPNRSDAASHFGVARDLAVYLRSQACLPSVADFRVDNDSRPIKVVVEDPTLAPRYMGVTMSGLTVKPSPEWLQTKLRTIGINPKNNIVDITNFVLHECGQPIHAFDLEQIEGGSVIVKRCPEGTQFTTLDGVERKLSAEDLMICNAQRPMCLAGVFGGIDSGVSDATTSIFIESAYFNPVTVRKSARRHGLSTDSSFRFERGTDPDMPEYAIKRAAMLIKELAGGEVTSSVIDNYPVAVPMAEFEISFSRINCLIGNDIPEATVLEILEKLEIKILNKKDGILKVAVPPYRVDVRAECDIVEEVLRIYGLNNIVNPHVIKNVITAGNQQTTDRLIDTISNLLTSLGGTEIMSNSLTSSSYYEGLESYKAENCVAILNPLSIDLNVMRQTLLFNAMEAARLNINRRNGDFQLYEFGNCYSFDPAKADTTLRPYTDEKRLAITLSGAATQPSWIGKVEATNFYKIKALAEKILERFGLNIYEGTIETLRSDLYSEAISYTIRGGQLFEMGVVSKKIRSSFDIKTPIYYLEMKIDKLQKLVNSVKIKATELNKFQPVKRDLALIVQKSVTFTELREAAMRAEKKNLKNINLFDVYEGSNLPEGTKSYALNFVIEDSIKTLTDKEIDQIMANIIKSIEKETSATVRRG